MIATGSKTIMNKKPELSKVIHEVEKHFKTKDDSIKKIILIKPSSSCIYWNDVLIPTSQALVFYTWEEVLFGSHSCMSLTDAIKCNAVFSYNKAFKNRVNLLLDFKTLDELDILLTLAGYNQVSA